LGQSIYVRDMCGRKEGAPPPVDLAAEKRNGDLVRALIEEGIATAVHDVSDGGLAVALAEMAMASGIGAKLEEAPAAAHTFWFGEDQARYLVVVAPGRAAVVARAQGAGVSARVIGTTGGDALTLGAERPILVATLRHGFEGWLPAYMAGHDET